MRRRRRRPMRDRWRAPAAAPRARRSRRPRARSDRRRRWRSRARMTRMCLRRMRRRRASSVRAWRCRERRERVRGVDRDAMRCDAMRVVCVFVRLACDVRRACVAVCACVMFMCVCARASRVGVARRSSSGGRRAPRATQSEYDWTRGRAREKRGRLSASFMSASVVFTHACTHGWMHGWMDGWMDGVIAARATRWIRERRTRAFDRAD